jgi:hypothetical protein
MATAATIKKNIAKLEAALKSKATPKSLKSKLETQLVKSKAELSGINKGAKPKTSTSKSAQTALQKLKEMVNKNKKLKTYKKSGVDLEKDADRPALPIGRRTAKQSGKTYYEYRANRIDVKQPPKRYPKLEKGGYMADGGKTKVDRERMYNFLKDDLAALEKAIEANNQEEINDIFLYWNRHIKDLEPETGSKRMYEFLKDDLVGLEAATKELPSSKEETDRFFSYWNIHLSSLEPKMEKGGYMAKGGSLTDNFSDKIEEGDIVWDERNKSYGVVLNTYDYKYGEIRLDSDGNQPIEYLHKLGSEKDKGTKAKLQDALLAYKSLRLKWPEYKYEKVNYEKGGYFAKGGAMEHGLKRGDTIIDDMFFDNSVKVLNNKTGYAVVHLETGERKEMKAMGGEMHRSEGNTYSKGGSVDPEKYPELQKIADKIADETAENINKEVKDVKSNMPYKAQWVLEEVVKDLKNRI